MISVKHLYRIGLAGILMFGIPANLSAQRPDLEYVDENGDSIAIILPIMADYFKELPKDLLPTLSENNRLDMLDFMESKMKAEVTNLLGGKSEMTELSDSTLSIRMSEALKVDMLLLWPADAPDVDSQVLCLIETFGRDSLSLESTVRFYSTDWELLPQPPSLSVSDQNTISTKKVQTILKRDEEILKKN
jgi:hypothetical protein